MNYRYPARHNDYTPTGEEWHICSFNAQPEAPAFFVAGPGQAGASGWALNESFSTGSGIGMLGELQRDRKASWLCATWRYNDTDAWLIVNIRATGQSELHWFPSSSLGTLRFGAINGQTSVPKLEFGNQGARTDWFGECLQLIHP